MNNAPDETRTGTSRRALARLLRRLNGETPRERRLVTALGLVIALGLLTAGLRTTRSSYAIYRATEPAWRHREQLLAAEAEVQRAFESRIQDERRTPTGAEFLAQLESRARECGMAAEATTPRIERHGNMETHRVRIQLRGATPEKLLTLEDNLPRPTGGLDVTRVLLESRESEGALSATYEYTIRRIIP